MEKEKTKKKFQFKNPSAYFTIMVLILIAVLATWIVPAGHYDRVLDEATGKEMVNPESFQFIDDTPVGLFDAFVAIPKGIANQVGVIAFIFIVSGSI